MKKGNIFSTIPDSAPEELFETLLSTDQFKLERIISSGQQTEPGKWYDQTRDEWVILLKGSAGLLLEDPLSPEHGGEGWVGIDSYRGEGEVVVLHPGDYIHIPAHRRHRVEWTSKEEATVWLALHFPSPSPLPWEAVS